MRKRINHASIDSSSRWGRKNARRAAASATPTRVKTSKTSFASV
jgi:hypothetical protein